MKIRFKISLFITIVFGMMIIKNINPMMSIYRQPNFVGNHQLSIYIQEINPKYNENLIKDKCSFCNCTDYHQIGLEPLIHCLISKSKYRTDSIDNATFIFVPFYTSLFRREHEPINLPEEIKNSFEFETWVGSRHLTVDSSLFIGSDNSFMNYNDEHVAIISNMTVKQIRTKRWMKSRNIQVPPLQLYDEYPKKHKTNNIVFIGNNDNLNISNAKIINDSDDIIDEICSSNFTILRPNNIYVPYFIYEILRCRSIPILISDPFLPAYANTHIDYGKLSMRIPLSNISTLHQRIQNFDVENGLEYIDEIYRHLMWPLDGIVKSGDAADIMFDYLQIRDLVLKPVLRRKFIGSDRYIET